MSHRPGVHQHSNRKEKLSEKVVLKEGCSLRELIYQGFQFSSVQSFDRLGRWGDMRDNSADLLFPSFLQEAPVSSSGMGRYVHSLMLSILHFLCWPQNHPPSKVAWRCFWRGCGGCSTTVQGFHYVQNTKRKTSNLTFSLLEVPVEDDLGRNVGILGQVALLAVRSTVQLTDQPRPMDWKKSS